MNWTCDLLEGGFKRPSYPLLMVGDRWNQIFVAGSRANMQFSIANLPFFVNFYWKSCKKVIILGRNKHKSEYIYFFIVINWNILVKVKNMLFYYDLTWLKQDSDKTQTQSITQWIDTLSHAVFAVWAKFVKFTTFSTIHTERTSERKRNFCRISLSIQFCLNVNGLRGLLILQREWHCLQWTHRFPSCAFIE